MRALRDPAPKRGNVRAPGNVREPGYVRAPGHVREPGHVRTPGHARAPCIASHRSHKAPQLERLTGTGSSMDECDNPDTMSSARMHVLGAAALASALFAPLCTGCENDEAMQPVPCGPPTLPPVMQGVVGYAITAHDEYESTECSLFEIYLQAIKLNQRSDASIGAMQIINTTPADKKIEIRSNDGILHQPLPAGEYLLAWLDDSLEEFGVPAPKDPTVTNIRGVAVFTQLPSSETLVVARAGDPILFFQMIVTGDGTNPEAPPP